MCHSRVSNNRINRLHERCLRIIYKDKHTSIQDLLKKDRSTPIHYRNLQLLAIEMFKVSKGIGPSIISKIFHVRPILNYNLRHSQKFKTPHVNTVYNEEESISFLGSKIWEMVPQNIKEIGSLSEFKAAIKNWFPNTCPCRLYKNYFPGVGFI